MQLCANRQSAHQLIEIKWDFRGSQAANGMTHRMMGFWTVSCAVCRHTERQQNDIITCNPFVALIGGRPAIFLWLKFEVQCTSRKPYRERARNHIFIDTKYGRCRNPNGKFRIRNKLFMSKRILGRTLFSGIGILGRKVEAKALCVDARAPNIRTSSLIKIIILLRN